MSKHPKRPTIAMACILKNELKNLPRLLESVSGCFDAIYLADTGSTDGSVEWIKENAEKIAGCSVHLSHFKWVNSFCKARNFVFEQVNEDYVLWTDLDDSLSNKAGFIQWRDYAMEFRDCWFATYNYTLDKDGTPLVSFVRERVFKTSLKPKWNYDLHEGITLKPEWSKDYAVAWAINHLRDAQDVEQDRSRNIKIIEEMKDKDARMTFYYGKELYEANNPHKAVEVLSDLIKRDDLELHDRILAYQYGAYAAAACGDQIKDEFRDQKAKYYTKVIEFALEGINHEPNRAEFYVAIGDTYLKMQELKKCVPFYAAAKTCANPKLEGSPYEGAVYSFLNCYGEIPSIQLAKVYFHLGRLDDAIKEAKECAEKYNNEEAKNIVVEALKIKELTNIDSEKIQTDDIVFTTLPQIVYPFDEELYKTKGMGGSETALIEMATRLKQITGKRVMVYNQRESDLVGDSGVEWISNTKLNEYFSKYKPKVHIAWRHNIKLTNAYTYLWCHDLITASVEGQKNFDKILCLTEFHKNYVMGVQNVPEEKVIVTRNGIRKELFENIDTSKKNPHKFVFMSSPDRGLRSAMRICDLLKDEYPDMELHCFYGLDNLYKFGRNQEADELKEMIAARSYVKFHGFTEQNKMYDIIKDASVWVHCATFIETSCITAMECLALKIFPVTRRFGGLMDTLSNAEAKEDAILLEHSGLTPWEISDETIKLYADKVRQVVSNRSWEQIDFDLKHHSWDAIALEWADRMELN